jgi:hypothetical protein
MRLVYMVGRYAVMQYGPHRYGVVGQDAGGTWRTFATRGKLSDAGMHAALLDDEDRRAA